ncbi:MAG: DUF2231 domain-containing protein [Pseudobdellovibrio sp.]|nr:DUF2231 domain-containing protein [Pseudobdellovibrio sp.]
MYSKVKILGQAVHPMLVSFPIVFYTAAFASFCLFQNTANPFWYRVAFIANFAGVATAVLAALPGAIDLFFGVPKETEARKRGYLHAALNVVSLVLFAINLYLIWGTFNMTVTPNSINAVITGIGFGLTVVAAYHGHTLVAKNHVGVDLTPEQEKIEIGHRVTSRVTT